MGDELSPIASPTSLVSHRFVPSPLLERKTILAAVRGNFALRYFFFRA